MDFITHYDNSQVFLMEGALSERLKREYNIPPDEVVALAGHIYNDNSSRALKELYTQYISTARLYKLPIMISTPTRRANKERVLSSSFNERIIYDNMAFLQEMKAEYPSNVYAGGLMGCKGDAYKATEVLSEPDAFEFHSWQAELFAKAGADYLYAGIMPALPEAIGMSRAMESTGLPYIISFMIRKNGRLIDGTTIHAAISAIDSAVRRRPLCYMTNCVHPKIAAEALSQPCNLTALVKERFKGIQANTSPLSPEELDNTSELKTSNAASLAEDMMELYSRFGFKIFGGCCGTDNTHMTEIAKRIGT